MADKLRELDFDLAKLINDRGGLFCFQVKKNQQALYEDLKFAFEHKYNKLWTCSKKY